MQEMTISKLYNAGIITDETVIDINLGGLYVAKGNNWYEDNVISYSESRIHSFTWLEGNRISIYLESYRRYE